MTIDEAIQHCEEVAMNLKEKGFEANVKANDATDFGENCYKCAEEHRQLAEWLKELKAYRSRSEIPNTCEDAISRDELLKAMDTWDKFGYTETGCFVREPKNDCVKYIHYDDIIKCIKGMPSVTPQQKTGRWIQKEEEGEAEPFIIWECSECHCVDEDGKPSYKYCPQCGAKMEVEE